MFIFKPIATSSYFTCCKNCQDRKIGCHSKCEKYLAGKKRHEKVKEQMKLEKMYTIRKDNVIKRIHGKYINVIQITDPIRKCR